MALTFGGSAIGRPGSFSVVDTDGMVPIQIGAQKVLAFVGEAPNLAEDVTVTKALFFNSPKVAKETLGSGELYNHMAEAWKHGADLIAVAVVVGTGTQGALQDTDWDTAINLLETETIHGIVPVTTSGAVQTKFVAHNASMSSVINRKERRGFYGHATGLTVAATKAAKTAISTERGVFASPGVYVPTAEGRELKPSTYLAAAYAGLWAKGEPQDPLTYQYVQFDGLEKKYMYPEVTELLEAGIAVTEFVEGKGLRIVQGVTTVTGSQDLTKIELSVSYIKDLTSQVLRDTLEERYVGKAGVAGIEVSILNDAGTIISKFKENGWISDYDPASIKLERSGTAFEIEWLGKPTLPINNFLIRSRFTL